jgi:primosomal protein N' (replication factor Y)
LHSKYDSNEGLGELLETLKNANKQKEVVLTYFQLNASDKKPITVKKLVDTSNSNSAIVKALIEKEI